MLRSVRLQRVKHNLATDQQNSTSFLCCMIFHSMTTLVYLSSFVNGYLGGFLGFLHKQCCNKYLCPCYLGRIVSDEISTEILIGH